MVKIKWSIVDEDGDPRWRNNCGLYAYVTTNWRELLYLGKVDGCTIRQRWRAPDKMIFWRALESERRIFEHVLIVGEIELEGAGGAAPCLTQQKLADIESLLIINTKPWGNRAATKSRISRPGMRVTCVGSWPLKVKTYHDVG